MEFLISNPAFRRACEFELSFRKWRRAARFLPVALLLLLGLQSSPAQVVSHEYELKAVFLYNSARFAEWPASAFPDASSPFVIGVLGRSPFGGALESAVEHETYQGRKFQIKYFQKVEEVSGCHILFISQSEDRHLERILDALKHQSVLTVSDIDKAADRGACVRFFTENNKIRLQINLDALKKAGLTMSSQLLNLAQITPAP